MAAADRLYRILLSLAALLPLLSSGANGIEVDNGVEGVPSLDCGADGVSLAVATRRPFAGHVFVKDRFEEPECRSDGNATASTGRLYLKFAACGVSRTRSADPRGVFVSVTVVVAFHPLLITKVDRAYMLQCFYMEASKVVTTELEVSMLTTSFRSASVPMPTCTYEVLDEGPEGEPIYYAKIGMRVYHKWTCETDYPGRFCMIVHSCRVDDGVGDTIQLLNNEGCSLDEHLLGEVQYVSDLMAGKEAHVFKYADRQQLYFDCQISIMFKQPAEACPTPMCGEDRFRQRRSAAADATADVLGVPRKRLADPIRAPVALLEEQHYMADVCMGAWGVAGYAAANSLLALGSFALLGAACYKRIRRQKDGVDF